MKEIRKTAGRLLLTGGIFLFGCWFGSWVWLAILMVLGILGLTIISANAMRYAIALSHVIVIAAALVLAAQFFTRWKISLNLAVFLSGVALGGIYSFVHYAVNGFYLRM